MLTLKEIRKNDIDQLFNTDELADQIEINGLSCTVIQSPEKLKEMKLKMGDGLSKAEILFLVRKSELPGKPKVNGKMNFGGGSYSVISCTDDEFTYEIVLESYQ